MVKFAPRYNDPPPWLSRLPEYRHRLPDDWPASGERVVLPDGDELELLVRTVTVDPLRETQTRQLKARLWRRPHDAVRGVRYQRAPVVLKHAGFTDVEIHGGYTDEPATADHETLVFLAEKTGG